ncbi:hypothetical protein [Flavobacterium faecale]
MLANEKAETLGPSKLGVSFFTGISAAVGVDAGAGTDFEPSRVSA